MKGIQERLIHRGLIWNVAYLIAATLPFLGGCGGTERAMADAPSASEPKPAVAPADSPVAAPIKEDTAKPSINRHAATSDEVQEAVARSGQNALMSQGRRFLVGDFNGDGSEDIAVVVKPVDGMLAKVNSQYAIWKLEDPHQVVASDLSKRVQRTRVIPRTVRAKEDDLLLMVIHGNGDRGWRDKVINGIYLLKNATGSNIHMQTLKESLVALSKRPNPAIIKGDVIKQTLDGESGFLFWTGAAYAWYAL